MRKYIQQLIQDLEDRKNHKPPTPDYKMLYPNHPAFQAGLDYIVEWEMAPQIPMDSLFNFEVQNFPPPEKLNNQQATLLVDKILELWAAFNFSANIPEDVPIKLVYRNLLKFWKEESITYITEGHCTLELCYYVVEECPWGEKYCSCKEHFDEMEDFEPTPVDKEWWDKGLQNHPDGSTSWINPDLLDEHGNLKKSDETEDDLPF